MNNFNQNDNKRFLSAWIINLLEVTKTCLRLYSETKDVFFYNKAKYFSGIAKEFRDELEK